MPVSLSSVVAPGLRLDQAAASRLLAAAARQDIWLGGCFHADSAGAEVWDSPRTLPDAVPLGAVRWSQDGGGALVITSVSVAPVGLARGEGTLSILARVLGLVGLPLDGSRVSLSVPSRAGD